MVTILKRGIPRSKYFYKGVCYNCQSEIEFQYEEAKRVNRDQRDGDYLTIQCPVCKSSMIDVAVDLGYINSVVKPLKKEKEFSV